MNRGRIGSSPQDRMVPHPKDIKHIPAQDQIIHGHYISNNSHWYMAGMYDIGQMFGFVILDGNMEQGEWGDFSLGFLLSQRARVDHDWTPKKFGEIDQVQHKEEKSYGS